ncbi:MAG: nuclear transport factor 2 family protein [Acidobacteria bacterium]|nr:nuclear transport factor 2 family protein [Acidobacteriota bacterium]
MTRFLACFTAVFLPCIALAQATSSTPAPAQAPVTSTASPDIAQFQKLEDAWDQAVNRRDQYGLENVLSPLFLDVSGSGDITTRNQQLAFIIAMEDKSFRLDQKVITVRMLGDTAVANGTYVLHHRGPSGEVDEKGVFTHVFERAHSGWLCINSQRTVLKEDGGKTKKKSNAELPFHIPIFGSDNK